MFSYCLLVFEIRNKKKGDSLNQSLVFNHPIVRLHAHDFATLVIIHPIATSTQPFEHPQITL